MLATVMRLLIKQHCVKEHAEVERHDNDKIYKGEKPYNGLQLSVIFIQAHSPRGELNRGPRLHQIYALKYPGDKQKVKFFTQWVGIINDHDTKSTMRPCGSCCLASSRVRTAARPLSA